MCFAKVQCAAEYWNGVIEMRRKGIARDRIGNTIQWRYSSIIRKRCSISLERCNRCNILYQLVTGFLFAIYIYQLNRRPIRIEFTGSLILSYFGNILKSSRRSSRNNTHPWILARISQILKFSFQNIKKKDEALLEQVSFWRLRHFFGSWKENSLYFAMGATKMGRECLDKDRELFPGCVCLFKYCRSLRILCHFSEELTERFWS